ncbi:MAG: ABC transporter ATP-binding protein [Elusimicrobia bacterium]|nr:ABC transporter ATP-binding protein [Elusimicrobiota bacterium]
MASIGIRVRGLSKRLKSNQALAGLTADFEPGLLHGLIGPDGAGKSTLLRTLVGLLRPDDGEIEYVVDGRPRPLAAIRDGLAYMPQQQSLYPDLSVAEHLDFFSDLYEIPRQTYLPRRAELLRVTRLEKFADRPAGQLSGGMYKKLGLMCVLLQSPSALLLDEPTNGVDPISRREFWALLHQLSRQGILVLMSTAYMDEAERCARVHLLDAGRVLASGEPRALLAEAQAADFDEFFRRRAAS